MIGPTSLGYATMVLLGSAAAIAIRWAEGARLGYTKEPGYRFVGVSCLMGAVLGAKLGMIFYLPPDEFGRLFSGVADLRVDGKTVLGALTGGYLGGELGKKIFGVDFSTGDALAVALPVGQALGRLGCFLADCCYGTHSALPWATESWGAARHPVQLYEAALCLLLAGGLFAIRKRPRPAGHLFRYYLIAYVSIRFVLEFFRGDPQHMVGPLSWAQVYCLIVAAGFLASILVPAWRGRRTRSP